MLFAAVLKKLTRVPHFNSREETVKTTAMKERERRLSTGEPQENKQKKKPKQKQKKKEKRADGAWHPFVTRSQEDGLCACV